MMGAAMPTRKTQSADGSTQSSGKTAGKKTKPKPPRGRPFQKGQSGNPGGRPRKFGVISEFLDSLVKEGTDKTHRDMILKAWFTTAIDRTHRDHMHGVELFMAYDVGRPVERTELSGPDGDPLKIEEYKARQGDAIERLKRMGEAQDDE